jgi:hypothetical protein
MGYVFGMKPDPDKSLTDREDARELIFSNEYL